MNCSLRGKVFDIVSTQKFDHFIMTIIMLSTITMAMSYFEPISNWDETLEYIDFVWSGIFFLEMILKMLGLGFAQYFRKHWNKFDFFIVMSSSADVLFTRFLGIGGGGGGRDRHKNLPGGQNCPNGQAHQAQSGPCEHIWSPNPLHP